MYKTLKTLVALIFVSILMVGCSAHAACDAYSHINNKQDNQQQKTEIIQIKPKTTVG